MKIALISTPFFGVPPKKYGGLERVVWDLANGLTKIGHKVALFAPEGSQVPEDGFLFPTGPPQDTVNVDWYGLESKMTSSIITYFDRFDVVHENNWFFTSYISKATNLCHTHHGGMNVQYVAIKPGAKNNLIAISNYMKSYYAYLGFSSEVAYNPVDLDEYKFKKEKGDRLLFVGRLDTFKQPEVAIKAAERLGVGIDVVGGSFVQDMKYLESIKQCCDITTGAKLHLDASQEEKIELYQNAKAVIFPSRMGEPFGLIVPEANACGTPVIGLRDGAITETIRDGVNGFCVGSPTQQNNDKSNDVTAIVNGVRMLDGSTVTPELCLEQAIIYSKENCAKRYIELYERVHSGNPW
jgi:glycosyltransferase involved in cell wall biosynthesis